MSVADSLAAWGIVRAPEVVELAAEAGLPLNIAAALLEQESGGGRNVWGSDGVSTGGVYVKGAQVTRQAYEAYRNLRRAGQIGNQGVGPVQLTSTGYQDQADQLGGCWDWRANVAVGFRTLAGLIRAYGTANGIRSYNGSGPMADRYREQVLAKAARWATRLGDASSIAPAAKPPPATRPAAAMEDDPMLPVPINVYSDNTFHGGVIAEEGTSSRYIADATLVFGVMFGSADVYIQFLGADGLGMGPTSGWKGLVSQNSTVALDAPNGCKLVSVEGQVFGQGVILTAVLMVKPKP